MVDATDCETIDEVRERCVALAEALRAFAPTIVPKALHWIRTPEGGTYQDTDGSCWCEACGDAKVAELAATHPTSDDTYFLDGGWGGQSDDTPQICCGCGEPLDHALTRLGVLDELAHFGAQAPGASDEAQIFEIARMVEGAQELEDRDAAAIRRCLAIGVALLSLLKEGASGNAEDQMPGSV